jgi:hypothetical protein
MIHEIVKPVNLLHHVHSWKNDKQKTQSRLLLTLIIVFVNGWGGAKHFKNFPREAFLETAVISWMSERNDGFLPLSLISHVQKV